MTKPQLLTTAEVCKRLGKSQPTVARMVASGKLTPHMQAPGKRGAMYFREADVRKLAPKPAD